MTRRARVGGIALLAAAAIVVVLLFVVFRVAGPPRWPEGAIFVPRDAATVEQALESASPGATIVLRAQDGPFRGPVTIDLAGVTLVSSGGEAKLEATGSEPALTIRADGVGVRGLEIASESVGIRLEAARCTIERTRIFDAPIGVQLHGARGCELVGIEADGGRIGLDLDSSAGNTLTDIAVRGASEFGLRLVESSNNRLEGVTVVDTPAGVSLEQGSSENELRGLRIEGASTVGIGLRGSDDNLVVDSTVRGSGTGVLLEGGTGNEILGCEISDSDVAGLAFNQAVQNRATENRIEGSQDAGILLTQGAENALSYNTIGDCSGPGIRIDGCDRVLIVGNSLTANALGIVSDRSSHGRILRNTVLSADRSGTGIRVSGGAENRILDNLVRGGGVGCLLSDSRGDTLLRNRMEGQATVGLSILDDSLGSAVAENRIVDNFIGITIAASSRSEVLNNHVAENDTGLLLIRPGPGVRIEGNAIEANRIGIQQTDASDIAGTELGPGDSGETVSVVVVNNLFTCNETFDVLNETAIPIYAGDNWWGVTGKRDTTPARVSTGVFLEGSAWRGTLAVGTESDVSGEILGRILQYALTEAGFRVIGLIGMGDSDRVREALRMQDVDFIWWGTHDALLPEANGIDVDTASIPATRRWTVVVSEETAAQLAEPTLSAFAEWIRRSEDTFGYSAPRGLGDAAAGAFEEAYGLHESVDSIHWAETHGEVEALLKFGAVEAAIVDNLEETLTSAGFIALEDDLAVFEAAELLVAFRPGLLARFPEIEDVLGQLADLLTTSAVHDLIGRVRLLQREPEAVAWEFLVGRGLLLE